MTKAFFADCLRRVDESTNEENLKNNWLVPLLEKYAPQKALSRRWEHSNQRKRKDLALCNPESAREVCNLELKFCTDAELVRNGDRGFFLQAHRYAFSQNFWRDRVICPVLGVLTNGSRAILFDGSLKRKESWNYRYEIDLSTESGHREFAEIFARLASGLPGHAVHRPTIENSKNIVVEEISKDLIRHLDRFKKARVKNPFDTVLQLFLVAVLRDCGYIPTRAMNDACEDGDWRKISELLSKKLSTNFRPISGPNELIKQVYQETRTLDAALNRVPPDCLGMIYEKILHKKHNYAKSTSYYTPGVLVDKVLDNLDIDPSQTVLDPTCGSGSFLTGVVQRICQRFPETREPDKLFSYVKNKLRGVDRDIYACEVSKAMLLAAVANSLEFDPSSRDLNLPNLSSTIVHADMFLWEPNRRFDIIVGNLPWGNATGKDRDKVLSPSTRAKIDFEDYNSFNRNVDVSSLALEHIVEAFAHKESKMGILIKQQAIWGDDASAHFIPWARASGIKFWDYYDKAWFANPSSLTAVAWMGTSQREFIRAMKSPKASKVGADGVRLSDLGQFFRGFQPSKLPIWRRAALDPINKSIAYSQYPDSASSKHFWLPKRSEKIVFVHPSEDGPDFFVNSLTRIERKALRQTPQRAKPYSYRGVEGFEFYRFDGSQKRIVMQQFLNTDRMTAMIDLNGSRIGTDSHTIFIPHDNLPDWSLWAILGWANTVYFRDELRRIDAKPLGPNRFAIYPTNLNNRARIPRELIDTPIFGKWVYKKILAGAQPEDIEKKIHSLLAAKALEKAS
jgi:hypothetical protein